MIERIHILGASGSGTTTLGQALSAALGYSFFDTDRYYWLPTNPPFQRAREPEKRIKLLRTDLDRAGRWILSGSLCGWGDVFIPDFDLVIYLWIPPDLRITRLKQREAQRYGEAEIQEGGTMYQSHRSFMEWARQYDEGDLNIRSKALHKAWLSRLECRVLELSGDMTTEERVEKVIQVRFFTKNELKKR
ncbi:MAG TPA: AAA family ATPase [Bacillota bacterium]|nr:AAA family ATPase [Bacillota bacterium]